MAITIKTNQKIQSVQIKVIQDQIMQWCSFLTNLIFYKIILIYLTNR